MARKDRVPNPPRRSQGPQRRTGTTDPAAAEQRRRLLLLVGAGALVVAAAVLAFVLLSGGDEGASGALEEAGCTLNSYPALANAADHSDVQTLQAKPKWNSNPPTSGPHWGEPAVWDFYDAPVLLVQTTHNLEHGGVIIHYGPDVPQAEIEKLREFYNSDPNGLVVAPLASNEDMITLSAWTVPDNLVGTADRGRGWLATCPRFDEGAFSAFIEDHRFKGPERLDPASLAPGT